MSPSLPDAVTRLITLPADNPRVDERHQRMAGTQVEPDRLPMLDVYLPMMQASALVAAGQLGLFQALADGGLPVAEIARRTGTDPSAVRRLATFLVTIGALEIAGDGFSNSPCVQRWFTRRGVVDYTPGLEWTGHAWSLMETLGDAVRAGRPDRMLWDRMEDDARLGPAFSSYMHAFAHDLTADLMRHIEPPQGARRLLDLGGSHGLHAISYCARHPELEAVIVDFPSALAQTAALIEREGMTGRIELRSGNIMEQDWGGSYDMVLLLSVAHNQSAGANQKLCTRVADVLNPNGMFVIHEYLRTNEPSQFQAAFDLTLLVETGTQLLSQAALYQMIEHAGLKGASSIDLGPADKGTLITAFK